MTREEAIKRLTVEIGLRSSGYYDYLAHGGKQDKAEEESLDSLQMAIAALREQSRWIPVTERLPEIESFVLCRLKGFQYGGNTQVCRYRDADKYVDHPYFDHYRNGFPNVTHWMPLPEPPEVEV